MELVKLSLRLQTDTNDVPLVNGDKPLTLNIPDRDFVESTFHGEEGRDWRIRYGVLTLHVADIDALGRVPNIVNIVPIVFCIDISESMRDNQKLVTAKKALGNLLGKLRADVLVAATPTIVRFSLCTFSTTVKTIVENVSLGDMDEEAFSRLMKIVENLFAMGGTDIHAAVERMILLAHGMAGMTTSISNSSTASSLPDDLTPQTCFVEKDKVLVLLTDGEITSGTVRDYNEIAKLMPTPFGKMPMVSLVEMGHMNGECEEGEGDEDEDNMAPGIWHVLGFGGDCNHEKLRMLTSVNDNGGLMFSILDDKRTLGVALGSLYYNVRERVLEDVDIQVEVGDGGMHENTDTSVTLYDPATNAFVDHIPLAYLTNQAQKSVVFRVIEKMGHDTPATTTITTTRESTHEIKFVVCGRNYLTGERRNRELHAVISLMEEEEKDGATTRDMLHEELIRMQHQQLIAEVHEFNQRYATAFRMDQPKQSVSGIVEERKQWIRRLLEWYRDLRHLEKGSGESGSEVGVGATTASPFMSTRDDGNDNLSNKWIDELKLGVAMLLKTLGGWRATRYSGILLDRQRSGTTFVTATVERRDVSDTFREISRWERREDERKRAHHRLVMTTATPPRLPPFAQPMKRSCHQDDGEKDDGEKDDEKDDDNLDPELEADSELLPIIPFGNGSSGLLHPPPLQRQNAMTDFTCMDPYLSLPIPLAPGPGPALSAHGGSLLSAVPIELASEFADFEDILREIVNIEVTMGLAPSASAAAGAASFGANSILGGHGSDDDDDDAGLLPYAAPSRLTLQRSISSNTSAREETLMLELSNGI